MREGRKRKERRERKGEKKKGRKEGRENLFVKNTSLSDLFV